MSSFQIAEQYPFSNCFCSLPFLLNKPLTPHTVPLPSASHPSLSAGAPCKSFDSPDPKVVSVPGCGILGAPKSSCCHNTSCGRHVTFHKGDGNQQPSFSSDEVMRVPLLPTTCDLPQLPGLTQVPIDSFWLYFVFVVFLGSPRPPRKPWLTWPPGPKSKY